MRNNAKSFVRVQIRYALLAATVLGAAFTSVAASDVAFQLDPQQTHITFTLGDVLHTVRGTFQLKQGSLHLDPASGHLTGAIVVDAKSGVSGNGMRDRKYFAARGFLAARPWHFHDSRLGSRTYGSRRSADFRRSLDCDDALRRTLHDVGNEKSQYAFPAGQRISRHRPDCNRQHHSALKLFGLD
jgi:hypothetical protein